MIIIETPRLLLTPFDARFRKELHQLHNDPLVAAQLLGGRPDSELDNMRRIAKFEEMWCTRGYGMFVVLHRVSGIFIGRTGPFLREPTGAVEVTWSLLSSAHGRGYATEAAAAAIDLTFAHSRLDHLACSVDPHNDASRKVAQKLGFQRIGSRQLGERVVDHFELARADSAQPASRVA